MVMVKSALLVIPVTILYYIGDSLLPGFTDNKIFHHGHFLQQPVTFLIRNIVKQSVIITNILVATLYVQYEVYL